MSILQLNFLFYNITSQLFVFFGKKNFKQEDAKEPQRTQNKVKIIIILYLREL